MSALARLQRDFSAVVQGDGEEGPGYEVYRNTYRAQMLACLDDSFPVLRQWLGEEDFTTLAIAYALACPPQSWSLDHFPDRFAAWLAQRGEDALPVDLARIETALSHSFVAPNEPVLTLADLPAIDWESARLALAGSCHVLSLHSSAAAIWVAAQEGDPGAAQGSPPVTVLVWRQGEQCHLRELPPLEADLLAQYPAAFADLCSQACDRLGEAEGIASAGALLAQWVAEGLLVLEPTGRSE